MDHHISNEPRTDLGMVRGSEATCPAIGVGQL